MLPAPQQDALPIQEAAVGRPDAHTQKYDRQLRLWASTGQKALETASILVINATATASSTLKNLVLPGIGKFTIMDSKVVTEADVGNNFFLERSSVGKSRAEEVVRLLKELNEDVQGEAIVKDISEVITDDPQSLHQYTLIIAVDVDPSLLLQLADLAWANLIPLIKVRSCGFFGTLRTQVQEMPLVETHPESLVDLRIHAPFPSLLTYAETFSYESMDSAAHSHVPAIIILIKALVAWKAAHDGRGPTGTAERNEFVKKLLKEKKNQDEENFDEAVTLFRRAGVKPPVPPEVQTLFSDPACETLTPTSENFWLLLRAVRDFVFHPSSSSLLPLSGALPDMKASSTGYVTLQQIYRTKAKEDLLLVRQLLDEVLRSVGRERESLGDEELETFVKHAGYLKILRGRSLREENDKSQLVGKLEEFATLASFSEVPDATLPIYLALLISDRFHVVHSRYPGTDPSDTDGTLDHYPMTKLAKEVLAELGSPVGEGEEVDEPLSEAMQEVCRAGAADLPQIAALMGGLVAQEAIKLTTRQYVPLGTTCVFNGVRSTTGLVDA